MGSKAGDDDRHVLNRRSLVLLEESLQPAGSDALMAVRILVRDQQRQLERLGEAEPSNLLRRRLGNEQVAVLERSPEDGARVAL